MAIITERDIITELTEMNKPSYTEFDRFPIDGGEVVAINGGYIIIEPYVSWAIEAYECSGIDAWIDAHPDVYVSCIHLVNGWEAAERMLNEYTTTTWTEFAA